MKNEEMARLFSEATPYIQKYHGKTMVVKYGGNAMINEQLKQQVMEDITLLWLIGVKVDMGTGDASAKAWGCDLTYDYVKINGDYRT